MERLGGVNKHLQGQTYFVKMERSDPLFFQVKYIWTGFQCSKEESYFVWFPFILKPPIM